MREFRKKVYSQMPTAQNNFMPQWCILDPFKRKQGQRTLPLTLTPSDLSSFGLALRVELCTGMGQGWTFSGPNILSEVQLCQSGCVSDVLNSRFALWPGSGERPALKKTYYLEHSFYLGALIMSQRMVVAWILALSTVQNFFF